LSLPSWNLVDWNEEVKTREDLVVERMRQLDQRILNEAQAAETLRNSRKANKAYFDLSKRLRSAQQQLQVGDLVLLHNTRSERQHSRKLYDNWRGSYRIREVIESSTYYRLEELDGTHLAASFAGNRLKRFYSRTETGNKIVSEVPDTAQVGEKEDQEGERGEEEADEETQAEEDGAELYWTRWRRLMGLPPQEEKS
jgi:hypothetical protein